MKSILVLFAVMLVSVAVATVASAYRLDEYLQAATFALQGNHVEVQMRLTPGVEVYGRVLAAIDTNGDGVISGAEQQGYAEQVSRDLSRLSTIDGRAILIRSCSPILRGWFG
jgi:hypothetical protein